MNHNSAKSYAYNKNKAPVKRDRPSSPRTKTPIAAAQTPIRSDAPLRLNRYLAQCGLGARRACDEIIATGHIFINDVAVIKLGTIVDPARDTVTYRGKQIKQIRSLEYYAYYKPKDVIVTKDDPESRTTIFEALKASGHPIDHLNYVGRLDRNSEGLLLLTNDGSLIHTLTHPRFHIKKVYRIRTGVPLTAAHARQMVEEGVASEDQILHAGDIRPDPVKGENGLEYWYEIDLYEGKNRQIRRMFETLGYEVVRLKRTQFGNVKLGDLHRGALRPLTEKEREALLHYGHPTATKQGT